MRPCLHLFKSVRLTYHGRSFFWAGSVGTSLASHKFPPVYRLLSTTCWTFPAFLCFLHHFFFPSVSSFFSFLVFLILCCSVFVYFLVLSFRLFSLFPRFVVPSFSFFPRFVVPSLFIRKASRQQFVGFFPSIRLTLSPVTSRRPDYTIFSVDVVVTDVTKNSHLVGVTCNEWMNLFGVTSTTCSTL